MGEVTAFGETFADMSNRLKQLETDLAAATGADTELDAEIHESAYGVRPDSVPAYTSSVDACLELIHERLPEWHCHIGYGPRGIFPYAMLTHDPEQTGARSEKVAPTVPLALLGAFVAALRKADAPKGG